MSLPYAHAARPVVQLDTGYVDIANRLADAEGLGIDWPFTASDDVACRVIDQALIDASYALDAPRSMPAGGCYGTPIDQEFAVAFQHEVRR